MANTIDSKDIDCLANVDESLQQRELNTTYKRKKKHTPIKTSYRMKRTNGYSYMLLVINL